MKLCEYLQAIPPERDCHDLGREKSQRLFVFICMTQFCFAVHQRTVRWNVLVMEILGSLLAFEKNIITSSRESK